MEFELVEIIGTTAPRLSEDGTKMELFTDCKIGVVGMPQEEKYEQFYANICLTYSWDISITTSDALADLQEFGKQYVADNYPTI